MGRWFCHVLFIEAVIWRKQQDGTAAMFVWSALISFVLSLLALGPLRDTMPSWLQSGAELLAVISLFVLVCLLESGGSNSDRANHAS
jgi:hypothetical protein